MRYDQVISLGGNCEVAQHWRRFSGRETAYPFDWWITPFETVGRLLAARFAGLFAPENMLLINGGMTVMCTHYRIAHHHDFPRLPKTLAIDAPAIPAACVPAQAKFAALADRFHHACRPGQRVLFLRSWRETLWVPNRTTAPDDIVRYDFAAFIAAIEAALPGLDFTVLFLNYGAQATDHPRALFHDVARNKDARDWSGSPSGWDEAFRRFVA